MKDCVLGVRAGVWPGGGRRPGPRHPSDVCRPTSDETIMVCLSAVSRASALSSPHYTANSDAHARGRGRGQGGTE